MTDDTTAAEEVREAQAHLENAAEKFDGGEYGNRGRMTMSILTDLQQVTSETATNMEFLTELEEEGDE